MLELSAAWAARRRLSGLAVLELAVVREYRRTEHGRVETVHAHNARIPYADWLKGEAEWKAKGEAYAHGWVKTGNPGTPAHDAALNELGGLAAKHSQEAADAIDRARNAAQEGRFDMAHGHLDSAAMLLHKAGRNSLATATEGARDSFVGAKPPTRYAPASRQAITPSRTSSIRDFEAAVSMPPGAVPVGSSYSTEVTGPNRTGAGRSKGTKR